MMRCATFGLLVFVAACGQLALGPEGDAYRACTQQFSAEQCSCAQDVLAEEHFVVFGELLEIAEDAGSEAEKRERAEYVLSQATGGDARQALAFFDGLQVMQRQCNLQPPR